MKIDKSLQPVTTVSVNDGKRRTDTTPTPNTEQENNVHLSSNITKLQKLDSSSASGSIVNTARIQEIKQIPQLALSRNSPRFEKLFSFSFTLQYT